MRKSAIFLLAIVMCIGLSACGASKYEKYEELFRLLEEERYDRAHKLINKLSGEDSWAKVESSEEQEETVTTPDSSTDKQPQVGYTQEASSMPSEIPITEVRLSDKEMKLGFGNEAVLTAQVLPADTTEDAKVKWSSSDASVVTVNEGEIKAVGKGTAVITATAGDQKATCTVTVANPTIATAEEFFAIEEFEKDVVYEIVADLDFAGYEQSSAVVRGTVEGNGYKIYNVEHGDVFGANYGTIRNLTLECNMKVEELGHDVRLSKAALAAYNIGTIENCVVKGTISITGKEIFFGAITPTNHGVLRRCGNEADIYIEGRYINPLGKEINSGSVHAGGITYDTIDRIEECYNTGNITAVSLSSARLAGIVVDGNGTLSNCYNTGDITAEEGTFCILGGIAQHMIGSNQMVNCCNFGEATGGLSGDRGGYIVDGYYLGSVSSEGGIGGDYMTEKEEQNSDSVRLYKLTDEQAKDQDSYKTLDFEKVWVMSEDGYPVLQWQNNSLF